MSDNGLDTFGISHAIAALKRMQEDIPKELDRALYSEGLNIFRKSQRIVPVDKGFLKGSGVIEKPVNHEVIIGYGGPAASYALYVHEDPEAQHKPGKSYKFLEGPVMEALESFESRLTRRMELASDGITSPDEKAPTSEESGGSVSE